MHLDTYTVGKFGGGVLNSPEAIECLPQVLSQDKCNIAVVSAFSGQTKLLDAIFDTIRNDGYDLFHGEFIAFHRYVAEKVGVFNSLGRFFAEKQELFANMRNAVFSHGALSVTGQNARAAILAMGEDFSSMIVAAYLKKNFSHLWDVVKLDARELFVATDGSPVIGAEINMGATKDLVSQNFPKNPRNKIYIVQGFICGRRRKGIITPQTALMPFDGSDLSAAVLASFVPVSTGYGKAKLLYYKQFVEGTGSPLPDRIYFDELLEYMNRTKSVVVSPNILSVPGMPRYFTIREYGRRSDTVVVMKRVTPLGVSALQPLGLAKNSA